MRRFFDTMRFILVSPEILLLLSAIFIAVNVPSTVKFLAVQIESNILVGSAVAAAPLPMLAWGWLQVWEMLDPKVANKILLGWPDYYMLKSRVLACLAWCGAGSGLGFIAIAMISLRQYSDIAAGLLIGSILAAASATVSLALARIRLREIIG